MGDPLSVDQSINERAKHGGIQTVWTCIVYDWFALGGKTRQVDAQHVCMRGD